VNLGAMSTQGFQHCTSCHDFKGLVPPGTTPKEAGLALVPKVMDCTSCHAMTQNIKHFDLALDPHKGNCGMCHDVHKNKLPGDAFKTCASGGCHSDAQKLTAFHRGLGNHALSECGMCHQAHSWKVRGSDCKACHTTINQDKPQARRMSSGVLLGRTHRVARRGDGARSAARFAAFVSVPKVARSVRDSAFLHSRHTSVSCTSCHSTTSSHGGLTFNRPAGCTTCHHSAQQRVTCTGCHSVGSLSERVLERIGILDTSRIVFRGLEDKTEFRRTVLDECGTLDVDAVEREGVDAALEVQGEHPEVGAVLLECSDLPPYSAAVQAATGLPVFDWIGFINYVHQAVDAKPYTGIF